MDRWSQQVLAALLDHIRPQIIFPQRCNIYFKASLGRLLLQFNVGARRRDVGRQRWRFFLRSFVKDFADVFFQSCKFLLLAEAPGREANQILLLTPLAKTDLRIDLIQ